MRAGDGDNVKALYRRGQAHMGLRSWAAAVTDLERALRLAPADPSQRQPIRDKLQQAKDEVAAQRIAGGGAGDGGGGGGGRAEPIVEEPEEAPAAAAATSSGACTHCGGGATGGGESEGGGGSAGGMGQAPAGVPQRAGDVTALGLPGCCKGVGVRDMCVVRLQHVVSRHAMPSRKQAAGRHLAPDAGGLSLPGLLGGPGPVAACCSE